jgi:hypothetical protein
MMEDPAGQEGPEPLEGREPLDSFYPAPPPEHDAFWSYTDLLVLVGLIIPCLLVGLGAVKVAFWIFQLHPAVNTWELLAEQSAGYVLLMVALTVLFRLQYDRPFWRSLGWVDPPFSLSWVVAAGVGLAVTVLVLGLLIGTPHTENRLTALLKNPTSLVLLAVFGSVVAPVCEELFFRGFVQPLVVRSLGVVGGIVATALPFGLLHFYEYGQSWRHVLLISISGAAFGWMRHATGSTKAAAWMHASYNAFQFLPLLISGGLQG